MVARFGSIHSELEGAANQQLKVNSGGTEFVMVNPPTLPSYTITNDAADRAMDAADVTLDEVANVLGTLIKDLATLYDGGVAAFEWSTSEQIYPYEKGFNGETLYCKVVSFSAAVGWSGAAHGVTNFRLHRMTAFVKDSTWAGGANCYANIPMTLPDNPTGYGISLHTDTTMISCRIGANIGGGTAYVYLIYSKA
jgi:hypothetical protein